jgi:hypothetical protein
MTKLKGISAFTNEDIGFLKEYQDVMFYLAETLDRVQGEKHAYLGCLLPFVTNLIMNLEGLRNRNLIYCEPLVDALLEGIRKRFQPVLEDIEYQLAAAFHPRFRLIWLEVYDNTMVPRIKLAMEQALEEVLKEAAAGGNGGETVSQEGEEDDFLAAITQPSRVISISERTIKSRAQRMLVTWLDNVSRADYSDATFLGEPALISLFVKYNTAIPSSAAVERFFSIGKDILRAKRSSLSDTNFDMLMFLKGNQHHAASLEIVEEED